MDETRNAEVKHISARTVYLGTKLPIPVHEKPGVVEAEPASTYDCPNFIDTCLRLYGLSAVRALLLLFYQNQ